jgi:hypothetical protein
MVNPVELTKLGVRARIGRLGSLNYILIASFLLLILGADEIWRYNQYSECISIEEQKFSELSSILGKLKEDLIANIGVEVHPIEEAKRAKEALERTVNALSSAEDELTFKSAEAMVRCDRRYFYVVFRLFSWFNPIGTARAQVEFGGYSEAEIRGIVIITIFGAWVCSFLCRPGHCIFLKMQRLSPSRWTA